MDANRNVVDLANLLFELDHEEHTIPYEAWSNRILEAGYSKQKKATEALREIIRTCDCWRKADNMAGRICTIAEGGLDGEDGHVQKPA